MDKQEQARQLRQYARQLMTRQRKANAVGDMQRRNADTVRFAVDRRRMLLNTAALAIAGISLLAIGIIIRYAGISWMLAMVCAGLAVSGLTIANAIMLLTTHPLIGRGVIECAKAEMLMRSQVGDDLRDAEQSQDEADMTRALFSGQARTEQEARQLGKSYTLIRRRESAERDNLAEVYRQTAQAASEYQAVLSEINRLRSSTRSSYEQESELRQQNNLLEEYINRHGF